MASKGPSLDDIIGKGIDVKNRRIYFGDFDITDPEYDINGSDFVWDTVEMAIRNLRFLEDKSQTQPIELHMSSIGGDTDACFRLIDAILTSPCQIKFFGGGSIMSSGSLVMCVCDERFLYPSATIMVHEVSASTSGKVTDMSIEMGDVNLVRQRVVDTYANNSRMPANFWSEIIKSDVYLSAQEAIDLGLADKIIEHKKRGTLRKARIAHLSAPVDKKELSKLIKNIHKRIYRGSLSHIEIITPNEKFDDSLKVEEIMSDDLVVTSSCSQIDTQ